MKLIIFVLLIVAAVNCSGQINPANPDSLQYQLQRKKINKMLAARSVKFSQYDVSLSKHTGIFGLQTKKDIRRSNKILMDIIKTDNSILQETKVLLKLKDNQLTYRAYQQQSSQNQAKETGDLSTGFMSTINKLRKENIRLSAINRTLTAKQDKSKIWLVTGLVVSIGLILFLATSLRRRKS